MADIIDASAPCGSMAGFLKGQGIKTVFRYYSRDTIHNEKRLSGAEAQALAAAGLRIGVVHEARRGDDVSAFSRDLGSQDSVYASNYAATVVGQAAGSAIYFAVDFDATPDQIQNVILPYFRGVGDGMSSAGPPAHKVGVYGSDATCKAVLDANLAEFAWLAQSTGWAGFDQFLQSGKWTMRQHAQTTVGGLQCDPSERAPDVQDIGDFALPQLVAEVGARFRQMMSVIARDGLRLRAGPGTEFDVLRTLPLGTSVRALRIAGDWTLVDLEHDGAADGFVLSAFLQPAAMPKEDHR